MTTQPSLPQEQVDALKAQFDVIDQDGDGRITRAEVDAILEREAYAHLDEAQRQKIRDSFASVDTDKDGSITFDEYMLLFSGAQPFDQRASLRQSFDQYDLDKDGFLTAEDFRRVSALQGEELSKEQADEMIKMADENEDGKVSFEEYYKIMTQS